MSLGIIIKAPEGIVLSADSRLTLTIPAGTPENRIAVPVSFDNARKLMNFQAPHNWVGIVTYGLAALGLRSAYSFLPELEEALPTDRQSVQEYARLVSQFFVTQWRAVDPPMPSPYTGQPMAFVVGGFNPREAYGHVFMFDIPNRPDPIEVYQDRFGITWGGQREVVDRLLNGYDDRIIPILRQRFNLTDQQSQDLRTTLGPVQMQAPVQFMGLQDCVNLAIFFTRATIEAQSLSLGVRGVGGPIDVAVITRIAPIRYIQEKGLRGEAQT